MKVNPEQHYEENYFYPATKTYVDEFGVEREYRGPSKDWHGFSEIAMWMSEKFPETCIIYDIGCGAGGFVSRACGVGLDAYGCDISRFAVDNCLEQARGKIKRVDITKSNAIKKYDLVTALDVMEHIYEKDLDQSMRYIMDSIKQGGYFFACIATARKKDEVWIHEGPDVEVPANKRWLAVSGHVHIEFLNYWITKLESFGLKTDYEKMFQFQMWRMMHPELHVMDAWSLLNIYIGRKS